MVGKVTEQNIKGIGKIPSDWEVKQLNEIAEFITKGATPTTYGFKWENEGIPFFKSDCIKNGQFVYGNYQYISEEAHESLKRSKVKSGDILISITGDVGKVAVIPDSIEEANINQHVAKITINNSEANSSYIYHWLNQKKIRDYYNVIKTGLAFPQISLEQVRKTKVPLPDIKEQEKIVSILTTWDKAIELKGKLIEQKKEQKKGLMQKLLTGETRFSDFDSEYKTFKISEVCDYQNGTALEKYFNDSDGLKVISIGNYSIDGNYRENNVFINTINEQTEKFILNKNDLTMVLNDKTSTGHIIGRVILIDEENKYIFNQRTMRLTVRGDLAFSPFLHQLINSDVIHKQIVALAKGGTQIYINTSDVLNMQLQLPNLEEQKKIYSVLNCMDNEIKLLNKELDLLLNQKRSLMQLLLTGKIRVKV